MANDNELHTINSCKRIVVRDNGTLREIKRVVYYDDGGWEHIVWPCRAELTDIYLVDLTDNWTVYPYTYTNNGGPSPRLIPNHNYAVKGTIKVYESPGVLEATLTDCFFFHETLDSDPNGNDAPFSLLWSTGDNSSAGYPSVKPKVTDRNGQTSEIDTAHGYNVYKIWDTRAGEIQGYSLQLGFYNADSYGFYTQNGFVFDDNYQTPIVVKRDAITQSVGFYTTNTGNGASAQIQYEGNNLQPGDTITFWPKYYKRGVTTSWSALEAITFEHIDYDTTRFDVTKDGQSYTITVKSDAQPTDGEVDLTFYTKYDADNPNNCEWESVSIEIEPSVQYLVKIGNSNITGSSFITTQNVTLDSTKTLNVYKDYTYPPSFGNDTLYNSNVQVTSSNSTIAYCSGRTITPGDPGTATITVKVDGITLPTFNVVVPATIPTVYYQVSSVATDPLDVEYYSYENPQQVTENSTFNRNTYGISKNQTAYFNIKFADDSLMNSLRTVYIDTDGESYIPGYYSDGHSGEVRVEAAGDNEWNFHFTKPGTSSSDTFYVELPVYAWWGQEGLEGYIGTITLTLEC